MIISEEIPKSYGQTYLCQIWKKKVNPLRLNNMRFIHNDLHWDNIMFIFSKIQGFVHDMGASMQGGIGGHAGLFGNAEDVAKVMYLFLNKGSYIDYEIFTSKSFELFNKRHFKKNRRGIGFDKPQLDDDVLSTCGCVSDQSFGHSGFTGTYAWADPKNNLIYVFLSNRTYPTMTNNKISENNIRTEVHRLINDALE